jgi:monoamine oxidase
MNDNSDDTHHVVIVGGGIAGLMAARELLLLVDNIKVTIVEACDTLGGRIRGNTTFVPHHVTDIGAEYMHGTETLLTDLVKELSETKWNNQQVTHEAFIAAHADGGPHPSCGYTNEGYYGRYYMNGELMEGNDKRLEPLHTVLATLDTHEHDVSTSVGHVLEQRLRLHDNDSLHDMAVAGYANTVGCTDLKQVSLHMLNNFERHWDEHEGPGDLKMDPKIGMYGIVSALVQDLTENSNFQCKLQFQVVQIKENTRVHVTSRSGETLTANAVIVTVPPPFLPTLGLQLSKTKLQALEYIGFDTAIKFILKFSSRLWPSHLENIICAGCLVPEVWFHNYDDESLYTATCFLTSDLARNFIKQSTTIVNKDEVCLETAARLVMRQLSEMLQVTESNFQEAYVDSLFFNWSNDPFIQGGYMYPKVGMTRQHLLDLAEPQGNVFFAGEATNTNACCTIQAAMETGKRAAKQVQESLLDDNGND